MRLLVCGGRDYFNHAAIDRVLRRIHERYVIDFLIHGDARGADKIAAQWAERRNIKTLAFPADWKTYKHAAGPIRNKQMVVEGAPDGVVAFPGGSGTANMVRQSLAAGVKVYEPYKTD